VSDATELILPGGLALPLAAVPGGAFSMGSAHGRDDERPVHAVHVAGFRLGVTPVTRAQYAPFLALGLAEPPASWDDPAFSGGARPVVGVTWQDACAYAAWLAELGGERVRLPYEAEWERAMRGGLEGEPTAWGGELPRGEIPEGPLDAPWPVGRGRPNGFGVLDPGTLVHEWCADWYAPGYYAVSPRDDPRGPADGTRRASRGGSWRHLQRWSPPSARSSLPPDSRYADYGLRVLVEG
jgi:formylglycine-generating enzyme required for sulfatase activity